MKKVVKALLNRIQELRTIGKIARYRQLVRSYFNAECGNSLFIRDENDD